VAMDEAPALAERQVDGWLRSDSLRVLLDGDQPVAMTGLDAGLPEIVLIGGVYTPPDMRGRGYARQAVALHLADLRAKGVERAVLSTDMPAAVRAYLAIGFRPIDDSALVLFRQPVTLPP
jgi:predicted GNAT family acetyltransferase